MILLCLETLHLLLKTCIKSIPFGMFSLMCHLELLQEGAQTGMLVWNSYFFVRFDHVVITFCFTQPFTLLSEWLEKESWRPLMCNFDVSPWFSSNQCDSLLKLFNYLQTKNFISYFCYEVLKCDLWNEAASCLNLHFYSRTVVAPPS